MKHKNMKHRTKQDIIKASKTLRQSKTIKISKKALKKHMPDAHVKTPKAPKCFNAVRRRYGLPSWKDITTNFGVEKIDEKVDENECLNQLSNKIIEKLESLTKFLSHALQPDTDIISLQEAEALSNKQKDEVFRLLSKAMILQRKYLKAMLLNNKQLQINFINQALDFWISEKTGFSNIIDEVLKAWKVNNKKKQSIEYLG